MKIIKRMFIALLIIGLSSLMAFALINNKNDMKRAVKMAKETIDAVPVETDQVSVEDFSIEINSTGMFMPIQELMLLSETQGKIINIFKQKGDFVNEGDVIAKVDDVLLKAQLMVAEANFEKMQKDLQRFENLVVDEAVTQRQLEEVRIGLKNAEAGLLVAQKQFDNSKITAPITGIINNDFIGIGSLLGGGVPVCEIVNTDQFKILLSVSESEVMKLKEGAEVTVTSNLYPEMVYCGTVSSIGVKANPARKYDVEIVMHNNTSNPLKAGMLANVSFDISNNTESLVISRKALVGSIKKPEVYVIENDTAWLRPICIEGAMDDKLEVSSGLEKGDIVVVNGQFNLKNGSRVKTMDSSPVF